MRPSHRVAPGLTEHHIARKRFGQHFLVDASVIDAIVLALAPMSGQALVEIGPGLGALSLPVLQRAGRLSMVEIDRDLAARWRQHPGCTVFEGDVLKLDFAQVQQSFDAQKLRVFGNLPYNVSSPILFHLLDYVALVQDQHFMLQKEVVERMVAVPASAAYGRLSVMMQWRYQLESVLDVPAQAFDPPPCVQSAVVRMMPRAKPGGPDKAQVLSDLVRQAFSQRRKLLRHALEPWLAQRRYCGDFDLRRRAEEVSVSEYLALAQVLEQIDQAALNQ